MARAFPIIRVKRWLSVAGLCLAAAACASAVLAPAAARSAFERASAFLNFRDNGPATILTAMPNGHYHQIGRVLSAELKERGSFPLEPVPTAGSIENVRRLQAGEDDFALIQSGLPVDKSGITAVAKLSRQYVHLIVPADSTVETIRDLAGRRIGVGPVDSGFESLGTQIFGYFNFFDQPVLVRDHMTDIAQAFRAGEVDAMFTVYSLFAPAMEELLASGWYRLVPIPEAEAAARYLPGVYADVLPHSLYGPDRSIPSSGDPFPTLGVDTLLVARADEPARRVETVLNVLYSGNLPDEAHLDGLRESIGRTAAAGPLSMHPAAEAFYARHDPISSDSFEIASFFLAGLVCLVSATHYLIGRRTAALQRRRREEIMPFFEHMLEFGVATENTDCPETLMEIVHEMMAAHRRAERAWLAGKLDTEHMENLYQVYNIRSRNAFDKMIKLQLQRSGRGSVNEFPTRPEGRGDFAGRRYWEREEEDTASSDPTEGNDDVPETPSPSWMDDYSFSDDTERDPLADVSEGIGAVRVRRKAAADSVGFDTSSDDEEEESDFEPMDDGEEDVEEEDKDQLKLF